MTCLSFCWLFLQFLPYYWNLKHPNKLLSAKHSTKSIKNRFFHVFVFESIWGPIFDRFWTPRWLKIDQKNVEMLKTQWIFTSQAKFCLSAGPFFATPIEDSRSHLKKPMGFWWCERESSIGVTKNGPAEIKKSNDFCYIFHLIFWSPPSRFSPPLSRIRVRALKKPWVFDRANANPR